jgi:hypothetical protein
LPALLDKRRLSPHPDLPLFQRQNANTGSCASNRGWWTTRFDAEFILYDPTDLAKVVSGQMESWQPQPYATIDIDEYLYLNPPEWDLVESGWGDQRQIRIGDISFDRKTDCCMCWNCMRMEPNQSCMCG